MKMFIDTDSENFIPKDFVICNFYGQDVCFIWNENEFVCFEYTYKNSTDKLKILKAPGKIKDIREFNERVFILCSPSGIYKLTDNYEFAILSKAGIELGSSFCEVLTPNNGIILENKKLKSTTRLFSSSTSDVHVLPLNYDKTDKSLRKVLLVDSSNNNVNLCVLAHDKKLFKMFDQIIQIIYSCDYVITRIEPVEKEGQVIGAILQTDANVVVLMHLVNGKLKYDNIFFKTNVSRICGLVDKNEENCILLIYSDGINTYYTKKMLSKDLIQEINIEVTSYQSFKHYQSKFIVFLNECKELLQVPIENIKGTHYQNVSDYVKLEPAMLKGLEKVVERIDENTVKLEKLKEKVMEKEDKLKRINLFINKQHLKYCPKDSVKRLLNQTFLISNFGKVLPENCVVVKMLKSRGKAIFAMKNVKNYDTVVEMPICIANLSSKLYTTTDLITYKNDGAVWCLIKNYIQDPLSNKKNKEYLTTEQLDFVKCKLVVLKNLMKKNEINMGALAEIKRAVREKIQKL